mmetsp:Transcript_23807/g.56324  ORF Transcript_23807/g.56324 Transcript_23807/m.56324 type:complete len:464 (+) Transcript_23807:75-1466(+)
MAGAVIPLVLSVFRAVVTVFLTGLPGFVAGYTGVFDQEFLQPLSRFLLGFMAPALMFHTLATRLTLEVLGKLWSLALWSCTSMAAALLLASLLRRLPGVAGPDRQGSDAMSLLLRCAVCFQNIGAFNFPLLQTLCATPGLFEGGSQQCFDDGVLMIFIYKMPWDLLLWTWGYSNLMALGRQHPQTNGSVHDPGGVHSEKANGDKTVAGKVAHSDTSDTSEVKPVPAPTAKTVVALGHQWLPGWVQHMVSSICQVVLSCNPILMAMLVGVPVGLNPALRGLVFGPAAPLKPLGDAMKGISTPVPAMGLQTLSGTLGCALREFQAAEESTAAVQRVTLGRQRPWLAAVVFGKLVLLPAVGFLTFAKLSKLQVEYPISQCSAQDDCLGASAVVRSILAHLWPDDRLFRTMLVMQWSAPSFLNLVVICHRAALDKAIIQSVAMLYLVMYASTIVTTTCWVGVGLAVL